MSPHKHEFFLLFGTITMGWWAGMSQFQKTAWAAAAFVIVGIAIGSTGSQMLIERTGALARLDRVERIAVRDSARVEKLLEDQQMLDAEFELRLSVMEAQQADVLDKLDRIDDRTLRMQCLLQGNRGPACL